MKVFLIRVKSHPEWYVGKTNPTYAIHSDQQLDGDKKYRATKGSDGSSWSVMSHDAPNKPPHWFVPRKRAKMWVDESGVRRFLSNAACRPTQALSFSEYEVEIDDNGIIVVPLDAFYIKPKKFDI